MARVIRGFAPEPLKAHYEEKSRAKCGAACRNDWLSAGQVGRLGVTFNARRSKQMEHRLIRSDVVILNTEHQCHPELVSGSQKLRRFRNKFGMTINKISPPLEIKDFGPPARGGHFVLFHSFLPTQPYGTQFHAIHTSPVQLVSLISEGNKNVKKLPLPHVTTYPSFNL